MKQVFPGRPELCGHRGMGAGTVRGERENTVGSFLAAIDAGLSWVEVDARVTADDVIVLRHDPAMADGRLVAALPAAVTDELGLPRLADVLHDLPHDIGINVEIKTSLEDAQRPRCRTTAALVADVLASDLDRRPILATAFDPAALLVARERLPALAVGLLTWLGYPLRKAIPAAVHLGADVVVPHVSSFGLGRAPAELERPAARLVSVAHDAGLEIAAWCPTPDEAALLVAIGVDCLIVDHAGPVNWKAMRAAVP